MMSLESQMLIILASIGSMLILSKYGGKIIHADWFYSGRLLQSKNPIDAVMCFCSRGRHKWNKNNNQLAISGEDIRANSYSLDATLKAKHRDKVSKEGKLIFYFTKKIECERMSVNQKELNGLEKFYVKLKNILYYIPKNYDLYKWESDYLLPSTHYEPCLSFGSLQKDLIVTTPSVSVDINCSIVSLNMMKFVVSIGSTKPMSEKNLRIRCSKSNIQLKSSDAPQIKNSGTTYWSEFLFKIPDSLPSNPFVDFNVDLVNDDNPLGDGLRLEKITGFGPTPPREFSKNRYECVYMLEINVMPEAIADIMRAELFYDIGDKGAKRMAMIMSAELAKKNRISINEAALQLKRYFISIQETCPELLNSSGLKMIDALSEVEGLHDRIMITNEKIGETFIIRDAFEKAIHQT